MAAIQIALKLPDIPLTFWIKLNEAIDYLSFQELSLRSFPRNSHSFMKYQHIYTVINSILGFYAN